MRQPSQRLCLTLFIGFVVLSQPLWAGKKQEKKVREARWVYEELFGNKKQKIPSALLADTQCVAVFPGLVEAALGFGGSHGTGVVSCRNDDGAWSPPSFVKISEGSFGLQIGYKASDMVLFFVTERSTQVLLDKKTTFGGTLKYAAGPTGGQTGATTDKQLSSDVYIYAKDRGLFGGMSLEGVRIGASPKALRKYYGHYVWPGQILFEHDIPTVPPEAAEFQRGLDEQPWE
jgi:lipid-binding SYLF domain-containing protein